MTTQPAMTLKPEELYSGLINGVELIKISIGAEDRKLTIITAAGLHVFVEEKHWKQKKTVWGFIAGDLARTELECYFVYKSKHYRLEAWNNSFVVFIHQVRLLEMSSGTVNSEN